MARLTNPLTPPTAPIDDVFAFCNHIAWQAGGPVLIHDSAWGVVAYSTLKQQLDDGRRAIILNRAVPNSQTEAEIIAFAERHFDAGVEAFEVPAYEGIQQRRVVAPVRMLGVHVGSIWIAESAGPLHPDAQAMARQAAKEASLYFQLREDTRRMEAERFARMLFDGSQEEALLAQYLGVPPTTSFQVVSVWHGGYADLRDQVHRVCRVLAEQQPAMSMSIESDDVISVAFYSTESPGAIRESARTFGYTLAEADERLLVGAGRLTTRLSHTPKSKSDADKVIAYLRRTPGKRVGSVYSLRPQIALMRLVEILDSQFEPLPDSLKPLTQLEAEDREEALSTLDAYFSHPGNASEAARALHIHPNTFRYRIAKVSDLLGLDLEDRDSRLILELELLRHRYGG